MVSEFGYHKSISDVQVSCLSFDNLSVLYSATSHYDKKYFAELLRIGDSSNEMCGKRWAAYERTIVNVAFGAHKANPKQKI